MGQIQKRGGTNMIKRRAGAPLLVAFAGITALLATFAAAPVGASTSGTGDPSVRQCAAALDSAPVDSNGAIQGGTPAACTSVLPASENAATATPLGLTRVSGPASNLFLGTYVPPSVTITPGMLRASSPFTAAGLNWPASSNTLAYAVAYNAAGNQVSYDALGLVPSDASGSFVLDATTPAATSAVYADLYFQSTVVPSAKVQLRMNLANTPSSPVAAPVASNTDTAAVAAAASASPSSAGAEVLGADVSRVQSDPAVHTAGLATTGGSQSLLSWVALLLGLSGWALLTVSRRRPALGRRR